jgi:hypothetical protein
MVDPNVMRRLSEIASADPYGREDQLDVINSFLAHDEDGSAYIDYLRVALVESEDPQWVLKKHDELINDRLEMFAKNKAIRAKYEWLRSYHDRTLESLKRKKGKRKK